MQHRPIDGPPVHTDVALPLKESVYLWVCSNPGVDAEDVHTFFDICPSEASDVVEDLLAEGRLGFAE